ncbi:MAG: alginate export family protein [Planctomycetes bacterium]|nr:alginate export family protein [Planctomycetota bacterium]
MRRCIQVAKLTVVVIFSIICLVCSSRAFAQSEISKASSVGAAALIEAGTPAKKQEPGKLQEDKPTITFREEPCNECPPEPSFWEKNPPVRIFPRLGNFPVPPSGEGYYSALDFITDNWRQKPPNFPYPPSCFMPFPFYDADFRYLDNPNNTQHDYLDCLHRIHLGNCWLFSTGGEFRLRYENQLDRQLSGKDDVYDLTRVRVYGDLWYGNSFRVYVEYINAQSFNQDLPPAIIDRNFSDLLNAFVDIKLADLPGQPAYLRIGRQEMLFGSERLISPLDWANTRRTFQGVRGFHQGEKFDVDLFWVQPVIPNVTRFDSVDNNQNFAGLWTTYRPQKGQFLDAYYLFLDNTNKVTQLGLVTAPYNVSTFGTRYCGDKNHFLWDVEGMFQFGERGSSEIVAGAGTLGAGYNFANLPMNPTFWVYYDYASGDQHPNSGDFQTFNQLFPFGHYYFGWLDLVGRQNIQDFNMHLFLYPTNWITLWSQYHNFQLASSTDALYNAAGKAIRRDATGRAGNDVGNEIDFVANFHLGPHSDVAVGYSKLFAGRFIRQTGPPGSPEFTFVQYTYRW